MPMHISWEDDYRITKLREQKMIWPPQPCLLRTSFELLGLFWERSRNKKVDTFHVNLRPLGI